MIDEVLSFQQFYKDLADARARARGHNGHSAHDDEDDEAEDDGKVREVAAHKNVFHRS